MQEQRLIESLEEKLSKLSGRDQSFANSLIGQYRAKNWLSEKQWPYVHSLLAKTNSQSLAVPLFDLRDASVLFDFFKRGSIHLKWPKLQIYFNNIRIRLHYNKYKNFIGAACYYDNLEIFKAARIIPEQKIIIEALENQIIIQNVVEAVRSLTTDLITGGNESLKIYGIKTGNCCFCSKELTDHRSVEAGYGPICAERYGLPWGDEGDEDKELIIEEIKNEAETIISTLLGDDYDQSNT